MTRVPAALAAPVGPCSSVLAAALAQVPKTALVVPAVVMVLVVPLETMALALAVSVVRAAPVVLAVPVDSLNLVWVAQAAAWLRMGPA